MSSRSCGDCLYFNGLRTEHLVVFTLLARSSCSSLYKAMLKTIWQRWTSMLAVAREGVPGAVTLKMEILNTKGYTISL